MVGIIRRRIFRGMRGKHLSGVSFPLKLPLTLPNKDMRGKSPSNSPDLLSKFTI
jgi:hypothetical protein